MVVEVVLVFSFGVLVGCGGLLSDVEVLVGVDETAGDNSTTDELGTWRGTNRISRCMRGSTSGFDEDTNNITVSERQMKKTIHRPGVIDLGSEDGIGTSLKWEP